jgi:AbrB family looped-hinge helix DNA binding protein
MLDPISYTLSLGDRGRLVIPADARARLGLERGDTLVLRLNRDGSMTLLSLEERVKSAQGLYADIAPGLSLADELIAERRLEAAREQGA